MGRWVQLKLRHKTQTPQPNTWQFGRNIFNIFFLNIEYLRTQVHPHSSGGEHLDHLMSTDL